VERHALVTGAAGFIGSHLCERLRQEGCRVTGVDCFTDFYDPAIKRRNVEALRRDPGFTLLELDLSRDPLDVLPADVHVVFHQSAQAGVRTSWGAQFADYLRHNVLATQRLLEHFRGRSLERFVYASSSSVYGDAESFPTLETALPRPFSPYGVTKLAGEHLVLLYGRNFGLPVAALRYFTVYGPRQRPDMGFHRFARALIRGEEIVIYGDGRQTRDFTFISDAVEANWLAWSKSRPLAVYNIGGGSQIDVLEAVRILEATLGRPARLKHVEPQPGDPRRTRADTSLARTDLGFAPRVDVEQGLALEAAWARELYGQG
jgi:UDP-glucose 4-epimerase